MSSGSASDRILADRCNRSGQKQQNKKILFMLAAIVALAGCGDRGPQLSELTQSPSIATECCADALRVRLDAGRNRLWVLRLDRLDVYDIARAVLIRRVELPDWYVADVLMCEPDMTLDRSGRAFISSNLHPSLWEIDPEDFQLKVHAIRLSNRERWDVGFGGLVFVPDGSLMGVTSSGGSLWSIDVANGVARQVELDALVPDACPFIAPTSAGAQRDRVFSMCAGVGSQSRRIDVSPDLVHGRVIDEPCDSSHATPWTEELAVTTTGTQKRPRPKGD